MYLAHIMICGVNAGLAEGICVTICRLLPVLCAALCGGHYSISLCPNYGFLHFLLSIMWSLIPMLSAVSSFAIAFILFFLFLHLGPGMCIHIPFAIRWTSIHTTCQASWCVLGQGVPERFMCGVYSVTKCAVYTIQNYSAEYTKQYRIWNHM